MSVLSMPFHLTSFLHQMVSRAAFGTAVGRGATVAKELGRRLALLSRSSPAITLCGQLPEHKHRDAASSKAELSFLLAPSKPTILRYAFVLGLWIGWRLAFTFVLHSGQDRLGPDFSIVAI